jgi:ADP-heptose:LPS heptosyltransferase
MSTPFQSVLFIELLGGIGDLLIALPAIQALARSHPTAKLTVLTFAPGAELLHHDPLIHQVISLDRQPHSPPDFIPQTIKALLQQQAFDLIVSDTNYDSIDQIIQQSSAVTNLWRSPPPDQRVGDRFGEILLAEGVIQQGTFMSPQLHLTAAEIDRAQQKLQNLNRSFIVLILDAGMTIKCWSTDCFIIVGQTLQKQYHATIVIPVGADREQAMQVVNQIGGNVMIWERGTLRELAAMLAIADLTIAADTGPARIAAALGTPTITLFGPSWSDRYGQPSPHINLQGYPNCPERNIGNFTLQPCWYSGVCPYDWRTCLEDISTAEVLRSAAKLLEPRSISLPIASPTSPWLSARNILVIRLDNIGDVLMISPALQAIKATLPDCRLTLMASPSGAQAAALLPWVDEVLPVRSVWQDMGKLAFDPVREGELIQNIRDRQFDAAIVFTSFSGYSASGRTI